MPVLMKGAPISPPRDEMGAVRDLIAQRNAAHIREMNAEHQAKLAAMKPTIDDDTEDDATGEERARLKKESEAKRAAALAEQKEFAHDFFVRVKQ